MENWNNQLEHGQPLEQTRGLFLDYLSQKLMGELITHQSLWRLQCSPMAVGPSDISGYDWCGPVNSSPAADCMSDENFGANPVFFWPKFELGTRKN